jgi:hypothetical protein
MKSYPFNILKMLAKYSLVTLVAVFYMQAHVIAQESAKEEDFFKIN